ncbi:MAG: hypothetical protein ACREVE_03645 [Gammaproteobacteria bacterium]
MKTNRTKLNTIAILSATLMAAGGQASVAGDHQPIWAGHFDSAYSAGATRDQQFSPSANSGSRPQDALIWAGRFEQAYDGSPSGVAVTRPAAGKNLLWAGSFKQAYQPAREEVVEGIELVMDRN